MANRETHPTADEEDDKHKNQQPPSGADPVGPEGISSESRRAFAGTGLEDTGCASESPALYSSAIVIHLRLSDIEIGHLSGNTFVADTIPYHHRVGSISDSTPGFLIR